MSKHDFHVDLRVKPEDDREWKVPEDDRECKVLEDDCKCRGDYWI